MKNSANQAHCWVLRDQLVRAVSSDHIPPRTTRNTGNGPWQAWELMWDRTYFENFTVDASIFVVTTSY